MEESEKKRVFPRFFVFGPTHQIGVLRFDNQDVDITLSQIEPFFSHFLYYLANYAFSICSSLILTALL